MEIRPYISTDYESCLELFENLIPGYFSKTELPSFGSWLHSNPPHYYVVTDAEKIIGCGGIAMGEDGKTAYLCWGLISKDYHRRGVGGLLLNFRIEQFTKSFPQTERIYLETTQKVQGFFIKHGFNILQVHKDKIAPGLDQVDMERKMIF